jgi:hypothetical protein
MGIKLGDCWTVQPQGVAAVELKRHTGGTLRV